MVRVALYVRVSTERQQQAQTIEQQVARLRAYVTSQGGWSVEEGHIFRDDGYSGAKLSRPGLDALRDQATRAAFDRVLITAPDRLARNYVHQMVILEELDRLGCPVQFIDRPMSDDPHDQLVLQIRGAVAEYERTLIAERMRRGRLAKLQGGRMLPWSRPPYGYRGDPERPRDPALVQIDLAQAAIVEEIFGAYADGGVSLYCLAQRLTDRKVPSPTGRSHWTATGIRCVLTNSAYIGQAAWGKSRSVPAVTRQSALKPVGSGASSRPRDAAEWITIPVPPIVSEDQFTRVRQRLATNRQGARRNMKHEYLLRGLVSCGQCRLHCTGRERPATEKSYRYYVCMGKQAPAVSRREERCPARFIPADQLDALVWADLRDVLQRPELITHELERAQNGAWLPDELRRRQATLGKVRDSLERQRQRLLDAYLAEAINLVVFEHKDAELRQRQEDVTAQAREIAANGQRLGEIQALAQSIGDICARLRVGLEETTFDRRRQLIELLIDRVIVIDGAVEIRYVIPTTEASTHTRFCHLRTDYFHPDAQAVPAQAHLGRREVGQHDPGIRLPLVPDHAQRADAPQPTDREGRAAPDPGVARAGDQGTGHLSALTHRLEGDGVLGTQQGMPAQITDALPEPSTPQSPIRQDQDGHLRGERRPQLAQEAQDLRHPRSLLVRRHDVPGDRDGAASIEHADHQRDDLVAVEGRVDGEGDGRALPPGENPAHERHKAGDHVDLGLARGRLIRAIVEPLPHGLTHGVDRPEDQQRGDDRVLAGAPGQDGPVDPECQSLLLARPQLRKVFGNHLFHLIPFAWGMHARPPSSRFIVNPMMTKIPLLPRSLSSLTYPCEPVSGGRGRSDGGTSALMGGTVFFPLPLGEG